VYGRGEGEEEGKVTNDVLRFNFVLSSEQFANILSIVDQQQLDKHSPVRFLEEGVEGGSRILEQRIMGYTGR
jgi:hypothetical protein